MALQEIDSIKGVLSGLMKRHVIDPVIEGPYVIGECEMYLHLKFSIKN